MGIILPHNFTPRDYQLPTLQALDSGFKRAIQVWNRRAGKDKVDFNYIIKEAARVPAQYYYFAPTYEQGRKIIWDNIDNSGMKMLDHLPKTLVKRVDNTRMLIELFNGSIVQVIGTEDPNKVVGTNPRICVFTEYSLQNPIVLDLILPIILANKGVIIINFTPRGKNHAYQLLQYAKKHPEEWFISILTVDQTQVMSKEALESERQRLLEKYGDEALFQQEYYCSFDAPVQGSYYGPQINEAEKSGRVTTVPLEMSLPVHTVWDLGIGDSTSIWFYQLAGYEIRLIDYLENSGEGLVFYIRELQKRGYIFGHHYAPHDIEVRELGSGKSRKEVAAELGIEFRVVPKLSLEDGIDAVRRIFNRCYFDKDRCERGLNALRSYQKEYDEKNQTYKDHPLHNWASNGSDAFRYLAVSLEEDAPIGQLVDETQLLFNEGGWY